MFSVVQMKCRRCNKVDNDLVCELCVRCWYYVIDEYRYKNIVSKYNIERIENDSRRSYSNNKYTY